jgi:hypothetical protein
VVAECDVFGVCGAGFMYCGKYVLLFEGAKEGIDEEVGSDYML